MDHSDQIGRFFALWATIQSRWQQLFYPNFPHCLAIFVKVSKSFIFLVKSFLGNVWRFLSGHTSQRLSITIKRLACRQGGGNRPKDLSDHILLQTCFPLLLLHLVAQKRPKLTEYFVSIEIKNWHHI